MNWSALWKVVFPEIGQDGGNEYDTLIANGMMGDDAIAIASELHIGRDGKRYDQT